MLGFIYVWKLLFQAGNRIMESPGRKKQTNPQKTVCKNFGKLSKKKAVINKL